MSALTKEIEDKALGLSVLDRVNLAEKLLSSLDSPHQFSIDEKWAQESEDRINAFERGDIEASEVSAVFERLENKLCLRQSIQSFRLVNTSVLI